MHPRSVRRLSRAIHLVLAALGGVAVYARPLLEATTARNVLAFVVFPLLALSGVVMWQQAALRRRFTGRRDGQAVGR